MAFDNTLPSSGSSVPMAEINMIPLIDVMLVLLVIFIVTAPLLTHAVRVNLPRAASQPGAARDTRIQLGLLADGTTLWNGERVERANLEQRMSAAAKLDPQPEVHLHADRTVQYQAVAEILSAAARTGLVKFAFVTDPTAQR